MKTMRKRVICSGTNVAPMIIPKGPPEINPAPEKQPEPSVPETEPQHEPEIKPQESPTIPQTQPEIQEPDRITIPEPDKEEHDFF
jgi:hypothetical protein